MKRIDIAEEIKKGNCRFETTPVIHKERGVKVLFHVSRDAVQCQNERGEWIRPMVTGREQQRAADLLGGILPTPKMVDLVYANANSLVPPVTQLPNRSTRQMGITALGTERDHSMAIDRHLARIAPGVKGLGLISTVGKSWVIGEVYDDSQDPKTENYAKRFPYGRDTAVNYGWNHIASTPYSAEYRKGGHVWQPEAGKHNDDHEDPSQTKRYYSSLGSLFTGKAGQIEDDPETWESVQLVDLLRSDEFAFILSSDGPLIHTRLVNVEVEPSALHLPLTEITAGPDTDRSS